MVQKKLQPTKQLSASTLLLTCIDYRMVKFIHNYMLLRGLEDDYSHIALASGALAVTNKKFSHWGKSFWDHLHIALEVHHIHRVILLNHRNCAAHRMILGEQVEKSRDDETHSHQKELQKTKSLILKKYPHLVIELLLMDLDGTVQSFA
ncbi:MAG: carbonic anhydrase [Alphaproteobacteria bacterium]